MWRYLSRTAWTEGNSTHIFQDRRHITNSMDIHYVAWERQAVMKLPLFVQCMKKQYQKWVKLISCIPCSAVTQTLKSSPWNRIAAFEVLSLFYRGTLASPKYFVYCNSNGLTCASATGAPCAYLPIKPHMSVILSQLYWSRSLLIDELKSTPLPPLQPFTT